MTFVVKDPVYPGRELRPYQHEAVREVELAHRTGIVRPAVVLPTGAGKSTVAAALAYRTVERGERVVMMAHRGELLTQLADSYAAVSGQSDRTGIVQANVNEVDRPVIVATVQTLHKDERLRSVRDAPGGRIGLVIVDEAHRAAADTYLRVLGGLGCFERTPALGLTATLSRGDDRQLGEVWEEVRYRKSIRWAIDEGYLVEPHGKSVVIEEMDLSGVKRSGGDFQDGDLGELIGAHADAIATAWKTHAPDRQTMVFVPSVDSAYEVNDALRAKGANAAVVVGHTPRDEREAIYQAFRDGHLNVMVSVAVLTEGFDMPSVNCVMMARPTGLHHVYVQAAGRGLRPSPTTGKTDCLILDVVGVSRRFPLTTLEDLGTGAGPNVKVTPEGDLLDEEELEAEGVLPPKPLRNEVELDDVDLFRLSPTMWLHTHRGTRFIPLREHVVFLWNVGPELYVPGVIRSKAPWTAAVKLADALPLEEAKMLAETLTMDYDRSMASKGSSWRRDGMRPSAGQIRYAARMGVPNPETFTRGALSNAMEVLLASKLLDRE